MNRCVFVMVNCNYGDLIRLVVFTISTKQTTFITGFIMVTICMKCQKFLFSCKNKKNVIINLSFVEYGHGVVKVYDSEHVHSYIYVTMALN